ncbi:MAG: hypothetical protein IJJ23_03795 [Clostridia bacterium]|nr:hypothetical protein [Clostridia bacterium]
MQLDALWNFMQVDMDAERYESGMRNSPNRLKLLRQRDFLVEQQGNMKKVEASVATMADRLEVIKSEAARLQGRLDEFLTELKANPPQGREEVEKQKRAAQKLTESLSEYEKQLSQMRKDSEQYDRMQKDIRTRAARTKAEYDSLKQAYEKEFNESQKKLAELKTAADNEAKKIEPSLLARYRQVKQHALPPMAQLNNDRCGGCNMSLSAATRDRLSNGNDIVECDNCGRILVFRA